MKNSKKTVFIIIALIVLCAIVAGIYLGTRPKSVEGAIMVDTDGKSVAVYLGRLNLANINGSVVNGKGETKDVTGKGCYLRDVLSAAGVKDKTKGADVVSDDGYHAELTADEVWNTGNAVLVLQEDGTVRMYVFGDTNSKRNVSNTVRITLK